MEIGISTATFFGKSLTEDSVRLIDDLGIPVCEIFLTTFSEYEKDFVDLLAARKGGLRVYSIHTLNQHFEPELFNPADRTRKDAEVWFGKAAYAAKTLGAEIYTFHGPARLKPRKRYVLDYPWIAARLRALDAVLKEQGGGARIAYETVHWTYFNSPAFIRELHAHYGVATCLDIKQVMQSQISLDDYLAAMGDSIRNVHLCDYDDSGRLAVPGKGTFDFVSLFRRLVDLGYNGPMMMELYSGDYRNFDEVLAGYEYLNQCLEKAKRSLV